MCPCSGKRADEMAAGRIHEIMKLAWEDLFLTVLEAVPKYASLDVPEMER